MAVNLLSIKDLTVTVQDTLQNKKILDSVSLDVPENSIVGLVGGSGSGKTTTGLAILRLLPLALRIIEGKIMFSDYDLLDYSESKMQKIRGCEICMVFQEPLNAFNPVFTIGYQIREVMQYHTNFYPAKRQEKVLEFLRLAGIKEPARVAQSYPHQLSGGMRQRAMIAQAIATEPRLIIADEPTSNLDVTLQANIIELFEELQKTLNLSILLITHDLAMVSHISDEVFVMSEGKVVEQGKTKQVLHSPEHPYTQKLMEALS